MHNFRRNLKLSMIIRIVHTAKHIHSWLLNCLFDRASFFTSSINFESPKLIIEFHSRSNNSLTYCALSWIKNLTEIRLIGIINSKKIILCIQTIRAS